MMQEYYIIDGKTRTGPYDTVALVRKIRNGTMTGNTLLQQEEVSAPKPAQEWPALAEFFAETTDDRQSMFESSTAQKRTLSKTLQSGWRFLQRNHYSTVFAGLLVLCIILVTAGINMALPSGAHILAYMAFFVAVHFMVSCYMLSVLRMARGQPVDPAYMQSKIAPAKNALLLSSLLTSIPAILGLALLTSPLPTPVLLIGLFIFVVPGLFLLAMYAFTPLLILDKGYDFWEAMEASRKSVLASGLENAGIIYGLFVINFLAALCFVLPMAITLPITMGALAENYDEMFT